MVSALLKRPMEVSEHMETASARQLLGGEIFAFFRQLRYSEYFQVDFAGSGVASKESPMPTKNVDLTEHHDRFVEDLVESGRYKNASEVLMAGLRLLEQQAQAEEQKLGLLKKLASEGFNSLDQGKGLSFSDGKALAEGIAKVGRRAAKAAARPATE